jgi:hypothetical protein
MAAAILVGGMSNLRNCATEHALPSLFDTGERSVFSSRVKNLTSIYFTAFAVRHAQRSIFNIAGFITEDRPQQPLFRGQFFFTFRRDLPDQDLSLGPTSAPRSHNAIFIEIFNCVVADIGNIARDLFRAQFGIAGFDFIISRMNR